MLGPKSFLTVASLVVGPTCIVAQAPASRPDAATIVAAITDLGSLSGWGNYADFDGCPQDDAVGREVLNLLTQGQATPALRSELIHEWADEFSDCEYAPLNDWVMATVADLAGGEYWHLGMALSGLWGWVDSDADQLLDLALDSSRPVTIRTQIADFVLRTLAPAERLTAFVQLLSVPPYHPEWVAMWSADLLAALGSDFVSALVASEGTLDGDTLRPAMGIILTAISSGSYSSAEQAFGDLVQIFAGRPGLAGVAEGVRATVVGGFYLEILAQIEELAQTGAMEEQHKTGLLATLGQALNAVQVDRPSAGPLFGAVRSQVQGLVSGGQLDGGDAQPLLDAIDGGIQALGL